MTRAPDILCIGSVLWDVIGRTANHMAPGADMPGRIARVPGGVALNIAATLARLGLRPTLLSAVGRDADGEALIAECAALGLDTGHVYRSEELPTDRYMAIEGANGLIAAIADAHSLEAAGDKILRPVTAGPLGSAAAPWAGPVALDGNLTQALLERIATDPAFAAADLRVAPASPGKAERLLPFLSHGRAALYLNRGEAELLAGAAFESAETAARALLARGARRVVVTDGARPACAASREAIAVARPPEVLVTRVTGAGDAFMAAHIAAEISGADHEAALARALEAAAVHVAGETPP